MDTQKIIENPFMLLSFIRSSTYFAYIFLYNIIIMVNHKNNATIFHMLKNIGKIIFLEQGKVKKIYMYHKFTTIWVVIFLMFIVYFSITSAKDFGEAFYSFTLMTTLALPNSIEFYIVSLIMILIMYLDELHESLEKIFRDLPKKKVFM